MDVLHIGWFFVALLAIAAFIIAIIVLVNGSVPCFNAIGDVPNCRGATICDGRVTLEPADPEFGGLVSTTTQSFSGDKKFLDALTTTNNVLDDGSGNFSFSGNGTVAGTLAFKEPVSVGGASRNILASETNSIITMSAAAARVYTLPPVATSAGLRFKFVLAVAGANTITIAAQSASQVGQVKYGAGAPTAVTGLNATSSTNLIFAASQLIGSWASYECDGTNWYVDGQSTIAAGFTVS